jgi:hypothetical protein
MALDDLRNWLIRDAEQAGQVTRQGYRAETDPSAGRTSFGIDSTPDATKCTAAGDFAGQACSGSVEPEPVSLVAAGEEFATAERMAPSAFIGRSAAMMCHPVLAWDRMQPAGRVGLAIGYAAVAYLTAFMVLIAL